MLSKAKIKYIQTLGQKKLRDSEGVFIAEGPKIIDELLLAIPGQLREIFATEEWILLNTKIPKAVTVTAVTQDELEKISQLTTPNDVLAIIEKNEALKEVQVKETLTVVLDSIQDPGNLGTIIRIADWFGIRQVICSPSCADIYNPKVIQSTMGSVARVNVFYTELPAWLAMKQDIRVYAAALEGQDISKMPKLKEGLIIIGNESKGIHPDILARANVKVTIPRIGEAESLNAAVATGIILSHLV